jgi:hypothetical protein
MPLSPTTTAQAPVTGRPAVLALLLALLAAALLAGGLYLINRSSAPSGGTAMAALALQGLSALCTLAAFALGVHALVVGPDAPARLFGGLAMVIALVVALAWLPAFFGIGL